MPRRRKPPKGRSKSALTAKKPLTEREIKFVDRFMVHLNAVEAAKEAGYSKRSAHGRACDIRNKLNVDAEIRRRMSSASRKADVTVAEVLIGLKELAFSNMADFIEADDVTGLPKFKAHASLTREQMAAVSEMTVEETTEGRGKEAETVRRIRFKLHNKRDALVDLGRYLKIFAEEKSTVSVQNNNTIVVMQSALSAADGVIEGLLSRYAVEGGPPALPHGPVLPADGRPSPA